MCFPRGFDAHIPLTECLCLKIVEVGGKGLAKIFFFSLKAEPSLTG